MSGYKDPENYVLTKKELDLLADMDKIIEKVNKLRENEPSSYLRCTVHNLPLYRKFLEGDIISTRLHPDDSDLVCGEV